MIGFVMTLVGCQEFTVDKVEPPIEEPLPECAFEAPATDTLPTNPLCEAIEEPPGGFRPIVEWGAGSGRSCRGTPVVGDIDFDGMPEIIANFTGLLPGARGDLMVLNGDGGVKWKREAELGYGSSFALGDITGDGLPEIIAVHNTKVGFIGFSGSYALAAYDNQGTKIWETDEFENADFDYAAAPVISDMDHDGSPEIIAGRVIFRADGTMRGKGAWGSGSWGQLPPFGLSEASVSAVADLDLDGFEEVIVGDARYDADGNTLWHDGDQGDGMVGIANLDDDPEGEVVVVSYNRVRVQDTNGRVIWGPTELDGANIVSPPAIADLDNDGYPEIVVAGGNELVAFHHDGTVLWSTTVTDESGASGASIFDFEGDGILEVVYADEIEVMAVEGTTGRIKFYSDEHASDTMMEYPVVADVDADDHAEIVVCHANFGVALSVYGDEDNSWRPARKVWNQHAYSMTNITDALTIPPSVPPSFSTHNTWHAGASDYVGPSGDTGPVDVGAEILGFCEVSCFADTVEMYARLTNTGPTMVTAGAVSLSLYAIIDGSRVLVDTEPTTADVAGGATGGDVTFSIPVGIAIDADSWEVVADDLGGGVGVFTECAEGNNEAALDGALCLEGDDDL